MGFEPTYTALQAAASPLGHSTAVANTVFGEDPPSGRRDSNPRPSPWQGDALPAEPRPRVRACCPDDFETLADTMPQHQMHVRRGAATRTACWSLPLPWWS